MEQEELERLKKDVLITDVAAKLGYHVKQQGRLFTLEEHDSLKMYPDTNTYYRFSNGHGGDIFNLVMELDGKTFPEALDFISSGKASYARAKEKTTASAVAKPKKPFALPPKSDTQKHVFAYLTQKRELDKDLVSNCIKKGLLYEDDRRNVVFVGYSYADSKKAVFASKRGTGYSNYRGDVESSNQEVAFRVDLGADKLFVTEAPIDALSMMCIADMKGIDPKQYNYLALCGVNKQKALYNFLKHNENTKQVIFALDNDIWGQKAMQQMSQHLNENYPHINLAHFKFNEHDLNDQLKKMRQQKAHDEQTMEV